MTKPPELKFCPFCGGAPHIVSRSTDERVGYVTTWVLTCIKCGARKSVTDTADKNGWSNAKPEETKLRVIAAWNNRTPDPAVQALVDLLREARDDLNAYVNADWPEAQRSQYPPLQAKWKRDMELCWRIDAALAAFDKTRPETKGE